MNARNQILTVVVTLGLLTLAGSGCSDNDDKGSAAMVAGLCAQLDSKQNELDCKVAALGTTCGATDTACATSKQSALDACNSLTTANWTSTRTSACAGMFGTTVSGTSTSTSTSTDSSTATVTSTSTSTATGT